VLLLDAAETEPFLADVAERFAQAPVGTLLSQGVAKSLEKNIKTIANAGAQIVVGGQPGGGAGFSYANTLLRVSGEAFLANSEQLQTEAFGNASLFVVADGAEQAAAILRQIEGSLTGCIYSHSGGDDDPLYDQLVGHLRPRVGRLINDKMPTGVAVSSAMQHGGPYPATGHPGFTAVGIPASLRRFAMLQCFDNVRPQRLPTILQNKNPDGNVWRLVDGDWTCANVEA
jgi:NADP-dependent aldehyde dehydrogenase